VSQEPGRTREMNFFRFKDWILVDLPGYGYAKVSKSLKDQWGQEIANWLKSDEWILRVVVLVDGRHGFQKLDLELIEFLRSIEIPFLVAFTKMDKWKSRNQKIQAESKLTKEAKSEGVLEFCFVSSIEKEGTRVLFDAIKKALTQ
jgi:GTP-binding protein